MDQPLPPSIEHVVKSTPRGMLILCADRSGAMEPKQYFIPAAALSGFEVGEADVAGQIKRCDACDGTGLCPACEGTGLNRYQLPCLWCTPGLLPGPRQSGRCFLCHGGDPREVPLEHADAPNPTEGGQAD